MEYNYLDIALLIIIIGFIVWGRIVGVVGIVISIIPMVSSLFITNRFYPIVSKALRDTSFYSNLKVRISDFFNLSNIDSVLSRNASELDAIETLDIPSFLEKALMENNNPIIYNMLNAQGFEDYISSYIANICLNVISMIGVFILSYIGIHLICKTLDLISKLPVFNFFNKTAGMILGGAYGFVCIWLVGIFLIFFYSNPKAVGFFEILYNSKLALFLFENNYLLFMILKVIG